MHKVIVLGAGRVGRVIARDLAEDDGLRVTLADRRAPLLEEVCTRIGCESICDDLADPEVITRIVGDFDLAIGALPGDLGLQTLRGVIAAGKACVDISFMPEDPRLLDAEARRTGARVLYDFGVAPGMSNLLAAAVLHEVGHPRQVRILVGGLPSVRRQPWEYAAPFSPADVMEEYVRPARIRVAGQITERPAMSGVEKIEFPEIGTLEAFYTDGLRSLIDTAGCPWMEEKTLRYPGYTDKIVLLRESGFFSKEPIDVDGISVVPRAVTLKILEPAWHLDETMDEFTVMRITVSHGESSPYRQVQWELLDHTDRARRETSMARTTGFPAAIAARGLLGGRFPLEPGIHPPEALATDRGTVDWILSELKSRGVNYRRSDS
jgi:saccharopine dehydrogenase-like NADP-dependent oxidoreductase